jgi:hypothetical protein
MEVSGQLHAPPALPPGYGVKAGHKKNFWEEITILSFFEMLLIPMGRE